MDFYRKYQELVNNLKRKKLLKKTTFAEAAEQFEKLADQSDSYTAALCQKGAARCYCSLNQLQDEVNALLKAARLFVTAKDTNLALLCYQECREKLEADLNFFMVGSLSLEIANYLNDSQKSLIEYQKAAEKFKDYPFEYVSCLDRILKCHVDNENFLGALEVCKEALFISQKIPLNRHLVGKFNICRLFLLLILEPKDCQMPADDAEFLSLFNSAKTSGHCIDSEIFLNLKSLTLACQLNDQKSFHSLGRELEGKIEEIHHSLLKVLSDCVDKKFY